MVRVFFLVLITNHIDMSSDARPETEDDLSVLVAKQRVHITQRTLKYRDVLVEAVRDGRFHVILDSVMGVRQTDTGIHVWCAKDLWGCRELLTAVGAALGESDVVFHEGLQHTLFIITGGEPAKVPETFSDPEQHANVIINAVRKGLEIKDLHQGVRLVTCRCKWGGLGVTQISDEGRMQFHRVYLRTDVFKDRPYTMHSVLRCLMSACCKALPEMPDVSAVAMTKGLDGTFLSFVLF